MGRKRKKGFIFPALKNMPEGNRRVANRCGKAFKPAGTESSDAAEASRLRSRLRTEALPPQQLLACVKHLLTQAGHPKLLSPGLAQTLCEHAAAKTLRP
jgi:hypothetical protein